MRTKEMREVDVIRCDFCGEETTNVTKCALCGKEGCPKDGMGAHFAYSGEIYRYSKKEAKISDARNLFYVCRNCANGTVLGTICSNLLSQK